MNDDRHSVCLLLIGFLLIAIGWPGVGVASPHDAMSSSRYQVAGVVSAEPEATSGASPASSRFSVTGTVHGDPIASASTSRFQIKALDAALAACAAPTDAVFADGFE